jgi:hypothetical protein
MEQRPATRAARGGVQTCCTDKELQAHALGGQARDFRSFNAAAAVAEAFGPDEDHVRQLQGVAGIAKCRVEKDLQQDGASARVTGWFFMV